MGFPLNLVLIIRRLIGVFFKTIGMVSVLRNKGSTWNVTFVGGVRQQATLSVERGLAGRAHGVLGCGVCDGVRAVRGGGG